MKLMTLSKPTLSPPHSASSKFISVSLNRSNSLHLLHLGFLELLRDYFKRLLSNFDSFAKLFNQVCQVILLIASDDFSSARICLSLGGASEHVKLVGELLKLLQEHLLGCPVHEHLQVDFIEASHRVPLGSRSLRRVHPEAWLFPAKELA